MSVKVAVLGDMPLVEQVIDRLRGQEGLFDLVEYSQAKDRLTRWYIICVHNKALLLEELGLLQLSDDQEALGRMTIFVPAMGMFRRDSDIELGGADQQFEQLIVTSIDDVLPHMVDMASRGRGAERVVEEAATFLKTEALKTLIKLTIVTFIMTGMHSTSAFGITVRLILLLAWLYYLVDGLADYMRILQGKVLTSPKVQKNNGPLQRAFVYSAE